MVYVSAFSEGSAEERDLLGGKGANLAEMTRMGLNVPPGFTITTAACRAYLRSGGIPPAGLGIEVDEALVRLEDARGQRLGDPGDPLLLSVRSGAPRSMPGMMDTVLNLGLNHDTLKGLIERTGDPRFGYDAYRRFLEMFGEIVLGVPEEVLDRWRDGVLAEHDAPHVTDLDADGLHSLCQAYRAAILDRTGEPVPDDPRGQLDLAIAAVFRSWNGRRARDYRALEGIPDDVGTAVNVQAMVFGNAGRDSGTGVAFTRDPVTGEPDPYGDFLLDAQGEDVVAGVRETEPLRALGTHFPDLAEELRDVMARLEGRYQDMCDIEFTIEHGELFVLQTRVGKRTAHAAVRIAVDLATEGVITDEEALLRVRPDDLDRLLHPRFEPRHDDVPLTHGLNASPGAAVGRAVFTADAAAAWADRGDAVVLVRPETSPDDLHGMVAAQGILTSRGGLVSHAAVVARGIGRPAVCGATEVEVDASRRQAVIAGQVVAEGMVLSVDGTTGNVYLGAIPLVEPDPTPELETLLAWADGVADLGVVANADTATDASRARGFGARGIGLCRTEHMFLGERLPVVQRALLASTPAEQEAALDELRAVQATDFEAVLTAMDGLPVTIRLLDAPMHEFLPDVEAAERWREVNPMMGVRGSRLGLLVPGVYDAQVRAIAEAVRRRTDAGGTPVVQIMLPLIVLESELERLVGRVRVILDQELGQPAAARIALGTMIETPRAALAAGALGAISDFFSFGTNDLTQMTWGFSRDDVESRLLPRYLEDGLLRVSPFRTIDEDGVGQLVRTAVAAGREANPALEIAVCGEHGGDPDSIAFFDRVGVDHVSCSPFRVPVARLAAAHAALVEREA